MDMDMRAMAEMVMAADAKWWGEVVVTWCVVSAVGIAFWVVMGRERRRVRDARCEWCGQNDYPIVKLSNGESMCMGCRVGMEYQRRMEDGKGRREYGQ